MKVEEVLATSNKLLRPLDINCLIGDASKAKKILKWLPKTKLNKLVEIMVRIDLKRWENHLKGKIFPWDAINDPLLY